MREWAVITMAIGLTMISGCSQDGAPPPMKMTITLAVVNARVWTGDPTRPWAEALAVQGDRIALVGSNNEIRVKTGSARVIDAAGRFVTPGFIDSHIHFLEGGRRLSSVQLRSTRTRDEFVAPPTPIESIYAAVTRRTIDGKTPGGWVPGQKLTIEEALRAYTVDAAYASYDEQNRGRLAQRMLADFAMIDRDLLKIPSEELNQAKIDLTVVAGKVVYER